MSAKTPDVPTHRRRGRRRVGGRFMALAAVLVFSGFVAACGSGSTTSTSSAKPVSGAISGGDAVTIKNFTFVPQTLTVKVGTTVTWTNEDGTPHNIRFADKSIPTSPDISSSGGPKTYSHTFTTVGTFAYICGIHNFMKGTIKVAS